MHDCTPLCIYNHTPKGRCMGSIPSVGTGNPLEIIGEKKDVSKCVQI